MTADFPQGQQFADERAVLGLAVADGATTVLCVPLQNWLDSHPVHWRDMARRSLENAGVIVQHYRGIEVLDIDALRVGANHSRTSPSNALAWSNITQ